MNRDSLRKAPIFPLREPPEKFVRYDMLVKEFRLLFFLVGACLFCSGAAAAANLVVSVQDLKGAPIPEAIVFLYEAPGKFESNSQPQVMDQIDKLFVPHVLVVLAGTKVRFPNQDNIHHHVYSFSKAKKIDLPLYKGEPTAPIEMDTAGIVKLGCNIHDWMQGYILVLSNPYFAQTGPDGRARIEAPAGSYKLALFSDRFKGKIEETLQPVTLGKKEASASYKLKFRSPYVAHQHPVQSY